MNTAYVRALKDFHGWVVRGVFAVSWLQIVTVLYALETFIIWLVLDLENLSRNRIIGVKIKASQTVNYIMRALYRRGYYKVYKY